MNFSSDSQRLKLLFPGTALSFDFLKKRDFFGFGFTTFN